MKKFFKNIVIISLFALFGFGALILRYCIFPFQKSKAESYLTLHKVWKFFIWLCKFFKILDVEVKDSEKIKDIKNSIIVSSHPSLLDIVVLMSVIPNSTCIVAHKLSRNPFLKGIAKYLFIVENDNSADLLDECCLKLNDGLNLIIFPMGTRYSKGERPKIRRGTALIAQKSRKNVVMLNLETSSGFLEINKPVYTDSDNVIMYTIEYIGKITTTELLEKYEDEVTFKTEVTKLIASGLFDYASV